jgi:hypothetical protein
MASNHSSIPTRIGLPIVIIEMMLEIKTIERIVLDPVRSLPSFALRQNQCPYGEIKANGERI